jgi:neutral trehalase
MANEARCMSKIASELGLAEEESFWADLYERIRAAVNVQLWDEDDGFYYDRELDTGSFKKVKAVSSFLPLFAGICEKHQAESLIRHITDEASFGAEFPVPSISREDLAYGTDMWRGPVWVNYNYMIYLGLREYGYVDLADKLRKKSIEAITHWYMHDGVIYEFYDSENMISPSRFNRKGKNIQPYDFRIRLQSIRDYGWTSALYIAWMMEKGR